MKCPATLARTFLAAMGFWGPTDSNVDWCEPNYKHSYYVAEWWNTVSNLPLFAMTAFGWRQARRHASGETRFWAAFCFLALVGVGSTLFHASLRYWAQLLDEVRPRAPSGHAWRATRPNAGPEPRDPQLPMLLCVSAFLYCLLEDRRRIQYPALPAGLAAAFLALTLAYTWFNVYAIFLVGCARARPLAGPAFRRLTPHTALPSYSALLLLLIILAVARCRRPRTSTTSRVLMAAALACYGTGACAWLHSGIRSLNPASAQVSPSGSRKTATAASL